MSNNSIFPGAQALNLKVKFNSSHVLIFHFQPDWTCWLYLQNRSRCWSCFTIITAPTLVQARAHLQGLIHNLTDFPVSTLAPLILQPAVRVMLLSQIRMPGFCWPHPEVFMYDNTPFSSSSFTLSPSSLCFNPSRWLTVPGKSQAAWAFSVAPFPPLYLQISSSSLTLFSHFW